jgi:hypothetical protein
MKITSKSQFFDLWKKGVLGNRTNVWSDPQEAYDFNAPEYGFREVGKGGGGYWERVERGFFWKTVWEWTYLNKRRFVIDDGVPSSRSVLQGEICRTFLGLESYLAVGYGIPPMRISMALGMHKHRGYLETKILLEKYMDPSSRDDLDMLLELYPEATVEFATFDVNVGNIPGRNTILWETRNY